MERSVRTPKDPAFQRLLQCTKWKPFITQTFHLKTVYFKNVILVLLFFVIVCCYIVDADLSEVSVSLRLPEAVWILFFFVRIYNISIKLNANTCCPSSSVPLCFQRPREFTPSLSNAKYLLGYPCTLKHTLLCQVLIAQFYNNLI